MDIVLLYSISRSFPGHLKAFESDDYYCLCAYQHDLHF